jgi:uncharacterized protein
MNKPFTLLIKPAGADCNIRCEYCFYLDHLKMQKKTPRMTDAVLEKLIKGYMKTQQPVYSLAFQGGEPTIMGLDFYKKVVELEKKYAPRGATVANAIQTNGILINDEFAEFLAANKFLVGLSLDGSEHNHNKYRKDAGGKGTHGRVIKAAEIMDKHGVEFNILSLVNSYSVGYARETYEYLKGLGFNYQQYIPCVEFGQEWCVDGEAWGDFLIELFDTWYPEDVYKVSIRYFDSIVNRMVTGQSNVCHMDSHCCQYFVVENDGSVYPCDFFVRPELKLGNIRTGTWQSFVDSPKYHEFGARKMILNRECQSCKWFKLCMGDCQKHRENFPRDKEALSHLCRGYKKFFEHAIPTFEKISAHAAQEMKAAQQARQRTGIPPSANRG